MAVGVIRCLLRTRRLSLIPLFPLLLLLALAAGGLVFIGFAARDRGVVFPGVSICGKPASGLTRAAAADLANRLAPHGPVRLTLGELSWQVEPDALGVRFLPEKAAARAWSAGRTGPWHRRISQRVLLRFSPLDVSIPCSFDETRCRSALSRLADKLPRQPRNASATLISGKVKILPGQPGGTLDVEASLERAKRWAAAGGQGPVELQGVLLKPRITTHDLRDVTSVISTFSTSLGGSSASRRHNVRLAAQAISGTVLMPGDVFRFNDVVGPRTPQAGYRTAPVLRQGLLVPGTGGGACQVSSTLYNAALLANLEIVQRYHHSQPVPYIAAGRDATVWYGVFDLRFRNSMDAPVVLHASVDRNRVSLSVLGKSTHTPVRVWSRRRIGKSAPAVLRTDPTLPPGKKVVDRAGKRAVFAVVTRQVGEGSDALIETISRDYYAPVAALIRIGPAVPTRPEAEAAPLQPPEPEPGAPGAEGPGREPPAG